MPFTPAVAVFYGTIVVALPVFCTLFPLAFALLHFDAIRLRRGRTGLMWYSGTSREVSILGLLGFLASSWASEDVCNRLAYWAHDERDLFSKLSWFIELGFVFRGRQAQIWHGARKISPLHAWRSIHSRHL